MLGIPLVRKNFKENDQLVSIMTDEFGKVEAIARGVKKITAKNSSALEPFSLLEIELIRGKESTYLTKAVTVERFNRIRSNIEKITLGNFFIKYFEEFVKSDLKERELFKLLFNYLKFLNKIAKPNDLLVDSFILKIHKEQGLAPNMKSCIKCNINTSNRWHFDHLGGGIICEKCNKSYSQPFMEISGKIIRISNTIIEDELPVIQELAINRKERELLGEVVRKFAEFHGGVKIPNLLFGNKIY